MNIRIATSDAEISACYPVMRELRPHIAADEFLARVQAQAGAGYRLAFLDGVGGPVAVAGFRMQENLAWGRFLYVDDLVTCATERSKGHGAAMLSWLKDYAAGQGCAELHLDSGIQRQGAHRFYEREGMKMLFLHFAHKTALG